MESPIQTTQLFSRRGLGYLWERRSELDPGQVKLLTSLYNNRKKGSVEGVQNVTYKLSSKGGGKLGWGRYYGSLGSLEQLEKEIRGTLCRDYYYDIDIVNCHFVLLTQFARSKYGIDMPEVDKYISNREEFLAQMGGERDDAKTEVIMVLYGALTTNQALLPLSKEAREFAKTLSVMPEYEELFAECKKNPDMAFGKDKKKVKSIYGSFLSFILQSEEVKCMFSMKAAFEGLKWSVDCLAYDGVMIRRDNKPLPDNFQSVMESIKTDTGYSVELVHKPFSFFEVPSISDEIVPGITKDSYNEMKMQFEATNFYYMPSNEMVEVCGREMVRMSLEHAREYYSAKWRFTRSSKFEDYTTFFDLWRKDANRRIIRSIDMKPSTDPSVFVMTPRFVWTDDIEPSKDAVAKFQELIRLFGGEEQQEYITKWLAQIIQHPFDTTGTALVITGIKGSGKDTLFDFFMKYVIGDSYTTNYGCGGSQYFDKHDTGRMNKFLCKVEEANKEIFKKNGDKYKALITSATEIFNGKNQKPIVAANYNRNVITTNGACPVEMSNGERRQVVGRCSPERKDDFDYWTDVRATLFNRAAGVAVGKWLSEIDISSFNFRKIPYDEFQNEIVNMEKTSEEFFVEQWVGTPTAVGELFIEYKEFCISQNLPHAQNTLSFGRRMLPLVRDGKVKKMNGRDTSNYSK